MNKLLLLFLCISSILTAQNKVPPTENFPTSQKNTISDDPAAKKFVRECSACHTIGKGKLKGPDLVQAITWKDADLAKAVKKMEKEVGPMSDAVVADLVELLKDPAVLKRISVEEQKQLQARHASLAPADTNIGRKLFWGEMKLLNGGLSCNACHRIQGVGGTLGLDLTLAYQRIGEVGLQSAIEKSAYKIMEPHYRTKPITPQEAVHLTAYLKHISQSQPQSEFPFHIYSALAAIGITIGLVFVYRSASGRQQSKRRI